MKIPNNWLEEDETMPFKQFTIKLFELEISSDDVAYYHQRYQSYLLLHAKAHSASDEKSTISFKEED